MHLVMCWHIQMQTSMLSHLTPLPEAILVTSISAAWVQHCSAALSNCVCFVGCEASVAFCEDNEHYAACVPGWSEALEPRVPQAGMAWPEEDTPCFSGNSSTAGVRPSSGSSLAAGSPLYRATVPIPTCMRRLLHDTLLQEDCLALCSSCVLLQLHGVKHTG